MSIERIGETKWARKPARQGQRDKRRTHRHTLSLDTEVHFREQSVKGMFRCRTRDVGLMGAFLPSENMPITPKTDIELVFYARTRGQPRRYSLQAKVVRTANDGAALVFCPENKGQREEFRRFLLRAKVASRES